MSHHFEREIEILKKRILTLSSTVEESLFLAVKAVAERDGALAETVLGGDRQIDLTEVEVEEECLKILALYQPVATDLRFIIAVLKINSDLERIGDLAVNIAWRASDLAKTAKIQLPFDVISMAEKVKLMVRKALESIITLDTKLAREVLASDDEIDELHKKMYERLATLMKEHPNDIDALISYLSISRNLERVADHATNIAEDAIYMAEGAIVRHGGKGGG